MAHTPTLYNSIHSTQRLAMGMATFFDLLKVLQGRGGLVGVIQ